MLHKIIVPLSIFFLSLSAIGGTYRKDISTMKRTQTPELKSEVTIKKANYHLKNRSVIYTAILVNNTGKWLNKMSLRVHLLDSNNAVISSGKREIVDEFLHPGSERAIVLNLPEKSTILAIDAVSSFEVNHLEREFPKIEIVKEQLVKIPTGYKLNGIVNNNSKKEMRGLNIQGVLFDKNGNVLSENQYKFNATLLPNSKTKFSIYYNSKNLLGTPMLYKLFPGKTPL